jgi:hypothetical protein
MSILTDQIDLITTTDPVVNTRVNDPPPDGTDLGYGSDLWCVDDLKETMDEIPNSDSPLAIAQANYRRLRTSRGQLYDDLDYGLDIRSFVNKGVTVAELQSIAGQIRNELLKDDRNESIVVTMTPNESNFPGTGYEIRIDGVTAQGPFTLTLALTDADVLIKEIQGQSD